MPFQNERVGREMDPAVERCSPGKGVLRRAVQAAGFMACAGAALLLPAPAIAGDSPWYVAGRFGEASADWSYGPPVFGWSFHETDELAAIDVGYSAHRFLSLQVGYSDFGSFLGLPRECPQHEQCPLALVDPLALPASLAEVELRGYSLSAIPRWPVSPRAALYGKVGWLRWEADLTRPGDGQRLGDASNDELLLGAGAEYRFPSGFGLLVEYEGTDLIEVVALGASWRF